MTNQEFSWQKEYANQRRGRLIESLCEYLEDEEVGLDVLIEDFKLCAAELKEPHEASIASIENFLKMLP